MHLLRNLSISRLRQAALRRRSDGITGCCSARLGALEGLLTWSWVERERSLARSVQAGLTTEHVFW